MCIQTTIGGGFSQMRIEFRSQIPVQWMLQKWIQCALVC